MPPLKTMLDNTVQLNVDNSKSSMRVLLSESQRSEFLQTHQDPQMNWENSGNLYIFQQHLAGARQEIAENKRELIEKEEEQARKEGLLPGSSYEKARSRIGLALAPQIKKLEQSDALMRDMHALSACFIGLEGLINNPPFAEEVSYSPEKSFEKIKSDIHAFTDNIKETIKQLKGEITNKYGDNPRIARLYAELEAKVEGRITAINDRIVLMGDKPTTVEINNLLKLKNYEGNQKSLGILSADCLVDIRDIGLKINRALLGSVVNFQQGPAGLALSDIGADINEKMATIHGAQVDNDAPIPTSQLALLTRPVVSQTAGDLKYLNVTHYMPKGQQDNPKAKMKMLQSMGIEVDADIPLNSDNPLTRLAAGILDIPGLIIFSAIQLIAEPIIALEEGVTRLFVARPETQKQSWAQSFHEGLHAVWRSTSLLSRAKGENSSVQSAAIVTVNPLLEKDDANEKTESTNVKLSDIVGATPPPKNQFISTMDAYFSPAAVSRFLASDSNAKQQSWTTAVYNFMQSRFDSPLSTLTGDVRQLGKSQKTRVNEAQEAYKQGIIANQAKVNSAIYQELERELADLSSENYTDPEYSKAMRLNATPASLIQYVSVGFAKHLLEAPARHNPIPATAYFLLASGSLGSLMAPTLFVPLLKVAAPLFHTLPNIASQVFTGQKATSLMPQAAACTLEFKALFFGTTLTKKAIQGKLDLSELDNPETLIAGGIALVAFGLAVSCMPLLPTDIAFGGRELFNPYAQMLDMFVEETHHLTTLYSGNPAMDATLPARALGLGFLGFKFGTLIYDALKIPGPTQGDYDSGKVIEYSVSQTQVIEFVSEFVKEIHQIANDPTQTQAMKNEGDLERIIEERLNEKLKTSDLSDDIKIKITAQLPHLKEDLSHKEKREKSAQLIAAADARIVSANEVFTRVKPSAADLSSMIATKSTYQNLHDVLEVKHNIDLVGNSYFKSKAQAQQFYDHLHYTFEAYNKEHPENPIASKAVLEEFYRDHCYNPPNTVVRALSIIPFYPITLAARAIGYATAKPSRREEIRKYAANDALISIQMLGAMTAFGGVATRYISNAARPLVIAAAIPRVVAERLTNTTPAYAKGATMLERAGDIATDARLHKAFHWGPFEFISGKVHSVVQRISRIAQDSSSEKNHNTIATNRAIAEINDPHLTAIKAAVAKVEKTQQARDMHIENTDEWIKAHREHIEAQHEHHEIHQKISDVHVSAKALFKPLVEKAALDEALDTSNTNTIHH